MAKKLPPPLAGILLVGACVANHVHGTIAILPAYSVETRLSFLCRHLDILMLEAYAEAVFTYGFS